MEASGVSPDERLVEIVEIPSHPYFIATQFHPEFTSRLDDPNPLFAGLVKAALGYKRRLNADRTAPANLPVEK
jgi:CTP synthase